jgi:crotonobetainyl-CoA:carnitine CoA-transferase CaiB-like acyl-CoA transferase
VTIQAVSGLIAATGFPDGPSVKAGPRPEEIVVLARPQLLSARA